MKNAHEVAKIVTEVVLSKIHNAQAVADEVMDVIEQIIIITAKDGQSKTQFYPLRMNRFDSDEANKAYIRRIIDNLTAADYTAKYNHTGEFIEIKWPY